MKREGFRAILLGGCLLAAAADALVVKSSTERGLLGLALLVGAALVLFGTRGSRDAKTAEELSTELGSSLPAVQEPAAAPVPAPAPTPAQAPEPKARKQLSLRGLLPAKRTSKVDTALAEIRRELEAQQQLTSELRVKLGHQDGLRRAMWQTIEDRFNGIEAAQRNEIAALRQAREHHRAGIENLQERLETHKRELAALEQVLGDAEPQQTLPASLAS